MSLEESILALTAAVVANTAALGAAPKATKAKKGETESAPTSTPVTPPATAPAGSTVTTSAPTSPQPTAVNAQLLDQTTQAVIKLANEYSREKAVGILAKYKVTRCSDLKPEQLQPVLNEAVTEIAALEAAKQTATANASLV